MISRVGIFAAAVAAAVPLVVAAPASAGAGSCVALPAGTPEIAIHTTGPDPEVHVPPVSDVTLCVDGGVVLPPVPTIEREQCGGFGSCMKYYVSHDLSASAEPSVSLCYTVGDTQTCNSVTLPRAGVTASPPGVTCVGYDLRGGDPCVESE